MNVEIVTESNMHVQLQVDKLTCRHVCEIVFGMETCRHVDKSICLHVEMYIFQTKLKESVYMLTSGHVDRCRHVVSTCRHVNMST